MNEEILTEFFVQKLSQGMNEALQDVWVKTSRVYKELGFKGGDFESLGYGFGRYGFGVYGASPNDIPNIKETDFFKFDLKSKQDDTQNLFVVGCRSEVSEGDGYDGGVFYDDYTLFIAYLQGRVIDENRLKRDYYCFRVRDALCSLMATESERIKITKDFSPRVRLTKVELNEGEGFTVEYSLSRP